MRWPKINRKVFAAVIIVIIAISSTLSYEIVTTPSNPIPKGSIPSVNVTTCSGQNCYLTPVKLNESGKGFSATFELRSEAPDIIAAYSCDEIGFSISYLNKSFSSPYTSVAFYITQASYSLGNYTMTSYTTSTATYGNGKVMWLGFVVPENITEYDPLDHFYSGSFYVYITPVLFYGLFHFSLPSIRLHSSTPPNFFYIYSV